MSKQLFFEMRAKEISQMYDSTFSKKEAASTGESLIKDILKKGDIDVTQVGANLVKMQAVIDSAVNELKSHILDKEKTEVYGVKFSPVNGGRTINYSECPVWSEIKRELDVRTEQLKMAQKQETYDAYGNIVPKVSTSQRKDYITITF